MDTNRFANRTDGPLLHRMQQMRLEGCHYEARLRVVAQHKCRNEDHVMPSEEESLVMLQNPSVRRFCVRALEYLDMLLES